MGISDIYHLFDDYVWEVLLKCGGVDHSFTFKHYIEAFSIDWVKERGLLWTGTAWNSFNTTFAIAIILHYQQLQSVF